ncbi:MAG: hypothetical protein ABSD48_12615, partial [Armatimonadota bacterium]
MRQRQEHCPRLGPFRSWPESTSDTDYWTQVPTRTRWRQARWILWQQRLTHEAHAGIFAQESMPAFLLAAAAPI